jgi:hypothetical protein
MRRSNYAFEPDPYLSHIQDHVYHGVHRGGRGQFHIASTKAQIGDCGPGAHVHALSAKLHAALALVTRIPALFGRG